MKKTFTINLGGKVLNIDDDALESLQQYINALKAHYSKGEDGEEIMYDIVSRLAELFIETLKQENRESVSIPDVEQAISIMGKPEDIFDEEAPRETAQQQETRSEKTLPRKLFRDPQDRILGGVASGLATYLGIPVTLTRVCFLLMMFVYGIFFLVYIFMWMLVPKAVTPRQRLQMRGKGINVSNIEDSVREGFQNAREKYAHQRSSKTRDALLIGGIVLCFILSFNFLTKLISFPVNYLFGHIVPGLSTFNLFHSHIYTDIPGMLFSFKLATGALIVIPIFLLFYLLVQVFVPFKSNNKKVIIYTLILWIFALAFSIFTAQRHSTRHHQNYGVIHEQEQPNHILDNALYIKSLNQHIA